MFKQEIDPLALYIGLDISNPIAGARATPASKAISRVFKKAETAIDRLQSRQTREKSHSNLESNDQLSKTGWRLKATEES